MLAPQQSLSSMPEGYEGTNYPIDFLALGAPGGGAAGK